MAVPGPQSGDVKTSTAVAEIDGRNCDFVVTHFDDRLLIVVSQYGKFGTMVEVSKDTALNGQADSATYNTKVLFGKDDCTLPVIARGLAELLGVSKPLLFSLALKDPTPKTMRAISEQLLKMLRL